MLPRFQALGASILFVSSDPPEQNLQFRLRTGATFPFLTDPVHAAAEYFGLKISYRSPRAWVYPNGFHQPGVFAFVEERPIFGWIQVPSLLNVDGAAWRPSAKYVLRKLSSAVQRER